MVYLTNIQKAEELRQKVIDALQAILMSINYKTNVHRELEYRTKTLREMKGEHV